VRSISFGLFIFIFFKKLAIASFFATLSEVVTNEQQNEELAISIRSIQQIELLKKIFKDIRPP